MATGQEQEQQKAKKTVKVEEDGGDININVSIYKAQKPAEEGDNSNKDQESQTTASKATQTNKKERALKEDDKETLEDLGLGRAVDATNSFPWMNKTSFQARIINEDHSNIIGTDECNVQEYFEEEVSSVLSQQATTKLTIEEPTNSLSIGIDAEMARSLTETRKSVGERIVTRTVSFLSTFDDPPVHELKKKTEPTTFEAQLSEWLLDRIRSQQERESDAKGTVAQISETEESKHPTAKLNDYFKSLEKKSKETDMILRYCRDFIEHYGVTHYVYSMKLGAAEYEVMTSSEYFSKVNSGGEFGINKVAKVEMKAKGGFGSKRTHKSKRTTSIGAISVDEKDKSKSKVEKEAVLEITLRPLHSLVRLRPLYAALQWALGEYISKRQNRREGPFHISCGPCEIGREGTTIYWCVDNNAVMGTTNPNSASLFYIVPTDNGKHPNEFLIGYVGNDLEALSRPKGPADPNSDNTSLAPSARYLTVDLTMFGKSEGPLTVSKGVFGSNARFRLHSRVMRHYRISRAPIDTRHWVDGEEFFINCARRHFRSDSYVTMVKCPETVRSVRGQRHVVTKNRETSIELETVEGTTEEEGTRGEEGSAISKKREYKTACMLDVRNHNSKGPWMVFRLHPARYKGKKEKEKSQPHGERGISERERNSDKEEREQNSDKEERERNSDKEDYRFWFGDHVNDGVENGE